MPVRMRDTVEAMYFQHKNTCPEQVRTRIVVDDGK